MNTALAVLSIVAAICVIHCSIGVIHRLHWATHARGYAHFLGYGLSHVALAGGALLAAIDAAHGVLSLAGMIVVLASAGRILFDRRGTRR